MFNNVALDVVIGLVFVFLLYSLLLTIIQEIIANRLSYRAKFLVKAIVRLIDVEGQQKNDKLKKFLSSLFTLGLRIRPTPAKKDHLSGLFYTHPLIKYLGERPGRSKPSYLVNETFSKVIVDILRGPVELTGQDLRINIQDTLTKGKIQAGTGEVKICPETLQYIKSIWVDAQGDVERFRTLLENWFNETMDRTTGWYKQHAQLTSLTIGFLIAISFNVNCIDIANKLKKDPKLREQLVQQADAFMKSHPNLDKELNKEKEIVRDSVIKEPAITNKDSLLTVRNKAIEAEYLQLRKTGDSLRKTADSLVLRDIAATNDILGIGIWSFTVKPCADCNLFERFGNWLVAVLIALPGWLITALALSLGAPFWFDLLNKLMRLRSSVAPAAEDPKHKSTGATLPTIKRVG
jgi:hypothetical protein